MEKLRERITLTDNAPPAFPYEPIRDHPDPEKLLASISDDLDDDERGDRVRQERDARLTTFYEQRKARLLKLAIPVLVVVAVFVMALGLSNSKWTNPYYSNPYGDVTGDGDGVSGGGQTPYHITRSSKNDVDVDVDAAAAAAAAAAAGTKLVCGTSCPDNVVQEACSDASAGPVMGGLDFVQYFSAPDDGTFVGAVGSPAYQATYDGYTFYFLNAANQKAFEANPGRYAPMWGGFCAWSVAGEYCPDYYWSAGCLGPDGNWGIWTIQQDHLFFFYLEEAKQKFLADPDKYLMDGSNRWKGWFGSSSSSSGVGASAASVPFNTNCFFKEPGQKHDGLSKAATAATAAAGVPVTAVETPAVATSSRPDTKVLVAMDVFESSLAP
jgi:YHS domain-containing protein